MTINPGEATRLCIEALAVVDYDRHWEKQNAADEVGDALESGDLCIVSAERLAALEKVADMARMAQEPHEHWDAEQRARLGLVNALAELDALGGDDP